MTLLLRRRFYFLTDKNRSASFEFIARQIGEYIELVGSLRRPMLVGPVDVEVVARIVTIVRVTESQSQSQRNMMILAR